MSPVARRDTGVLPGGPTFSGYRRYAPVVPSTKVVTIGRYAIADEIASGGMASVHLGRLNGAVGFSRTVAIKRMHPHIAKDEEFVSMFIDEARLAARIRHPNVVQTLDVVQEDGELLLVMEYVHGVQLSLLQRLASRSGERTPVAVVAAIVAGMLRGLHAAHEATDERGAPLEIVHRDVSPHNVMVGVDGVPRVIDFGVAKAEGRLQHSSSGQLKGKVPYMAPEQVRGEPVTRRTDVFAAGAVAWEALVGRRLFRAENDAAIIGQVLSLEIEPPSQVEPSIPPGYDQVVMRALERKPERRYASALEMARALEAAGPVATPAQVAELVEQIARETLDKRSALVGHVESAPTIPVHKPEERRIIVEPIPAEARRSRAEPTSGGPPIGLFAALVGVAAIAGAAWLIGRELLREAPETVSPPGAPVMLAMPSASTPSAAPVSVSASVSAKPKPRPIKLP
ncbi:MAG: serine/threonine protein kinase [Sandaracinaceae bacterium]|nr:serine/threonine protein kinase [Sandaracinaceae bacterium]